MLQADLKTLIFFNRLVSLEPPLRIKKIFSYIKIKYRYLELKNSPKNFSKTIKMYLIPATNLKNKKNLAVDILVTE
jgi:hypothetical protein